MTITPLSAIAGTLYFVAIFIGCGVLIYVIFEDILKIDRW